MAFLKVKNRAIGSLASGVSNTDTAWTLASGDGDKFPASGDFHITCEDEIVKCTDRNGDILTVIRAQEGTSSAAHAAGKSVELRITAGIVENIQEEVIAKSLLTTQGDIIVRGASVPEKLGIGEKFFFPSVNADGNGLEYVRGFAFDTKFEKGIHFFHWTTTVTGSGSEVSKDFGLLHLQTGTTINSTARSRGIGFGWVNFTNLKLYWQIAFYYNTPSANSQRWIKLDADNQGDPTDKSIGFRIDGSAIKGFVHDGTNLNIYDLNTTFTGNVFTLVCDGTTVYWYVDNELKGSADVPPSPARQQYMYLMINVDNNSDATNNQFRTFISTAQWGNRVI